MQGLQPLGRNLLKKETDSGCIAAGASKAVNKTKLGGVLIGGENDGNCRCCSFGCDRNIWTDRDDYRDPTTDQVRHHCRKRIGQVLREVILGHHSPAFDIADFPKAIAKCSRLFGFEEEVG